MILASILEKWLSLHEIAEHLVVCKDAVYRWIANMKMAAHKNGWRWKFKISEIGERISCGGAVGNGEINFAE